MLYTVLYVCRSDGKLEITHKGRTEKNEPTPEQLDQTPDAKGVADYYRELGPKELKVLDWRRKLGSMLVKHLGTSSMKDEAFILHSLPESYRLFEHIKTNPEKNTKNHAGGGHDRQDAYLYGHPGGRRRRYRSPADFFPHLLWLVTDESGDEKNCACKICSPDEIQPDQDKVRSKKKNPEPAEKQPPPAVTTTQAGTQAGTQTVAQAVSATTLPQPKSIDQQLDLQYAQFLYRQGELVWFERGRGAWGLGIVVRRWHATDSGRTAVASARKPNYLIQPLSFPGDRQTQVKIEDEKSRLRPWLVWSPPRFYHPGLNDIPNLHYDTADWNDIARGVFGTPPNDAPGSTTIDGSILAAKAIDCLYTPFELLKSTNDGSFSVKHYNGLYLGGEKLWIGDVACMNGSNNEDVLVITDIVERTPASQSYPPPLPTVSLVGDVYKLTYQPGAEIKNLPQRMREDIMFHNSFIQKQDPRAVLMYWHLVRTGQTLDVDSLKSRWYETSIVMPIINPRYTELPIYERAMSTTRKIIARLHCVGGNKSLSRYMADRVQSFGEAVPPGFVITNGVDEPQQAPEPQQPDSQPGPQQLQQQMPNQLRYDMNLNIDQLGSTGDAMGTHFQGHEELFGTTTHPQQSQDYLNNPTTVGDYQQNNFFNEQMDLDSMPGFEQDYSNQDQYY